MHCKVVSVSIVVIVETVFFSFQVDIQTSFDYLVHFYELRFGPNSTTFMTQDPDDTLKRKTFELLYKMTKSSNVEVIVDRMIDYMVNINDNHYKTEIASRCVELAEQFAPSNQWFIQVITILPFCCGVITLHLHLLKSQVETSLDF